MGQLSTNDTAGAVTFDAAPGIHMISHGYTNCFVIETSRGIVLVDAGFPSTWGVVAGCLRTLHRGRADITALLITHGHFDHLGFAGWLREQHRVPIWAARADWPLIHHPYGYRPERPRALYPFRHPRSLPVLGSMVSSGALRVRGTEADHDLGAEPVPGLEESLEVVPTPGHTDGECVLVLRDRDAALTGDALVTLDPYTGRHGPRIVARAATHDRRQALESLVPLRSRSVQHVLTGHGAAWHQGLAAAVDLAVRDGGA